MITVVNGKDNPCKSISFIQRKFNNEDSNSGIVIGPTPPLRKLWLMSYLDESQMAAMGL